MNRWTDLSLEGDAQVVASRTYTLRACAGGALHRAKGLPVPFFLVGAESL